MRLLIAFFLFTAAASADPCRARCRDRARACKTRCKMSHEHFDDRRHRCLQNCELHEDECRSRC